MASPPRGSVPISDVIQTVTDEIRKAEQTGYTGTILVTATLERGHIMSWRKKMRSKVAKSVLPRSIDRSVVDLFAELLEIAHVGGRFGKYSIEFVFEPGQQTETYIAEDLSLKAAA